MRARRLTGCVAGVIALTLTAAGCGLSGGGSDSGDATAGGCKVDEGNVGSGKLTGDVKGTITFQTTNLKKDFGGYFNGVIKAFEKAHPDTTVKWVDDPGDATFTQRLVADAQGCTLPDVVNINVNTAIALTKNGYLLDLDKKAPDAGEPFVPNLWKSSRYADSSGAKVHSVLPWYSGGIVQTFNTDLMTKAGLDPAKPPTTVLGLFEDAQKVAEASDGKYYAFLANPQLRIPADWQQMDIGILSSDGKKFTFADDPKTTQWVEAMTKLYKAGGMPRDSPPPPRTRPTSTVRASWSTARRTPTSCASSSRTTRASTRRPGSPASCWTTWATPSAPRSTWVSRPRARTRRPRCPSHGS